MSNIATKGVFWSSIERFSTQGVQFVLSIILARMIAPYDFGLLAMLSIFIALGNAFVDSGFSNVLIQKQDRTEKDFSTVFYFNVVVSILIYSFLFIISPCIANFYDEPKLEILTKFVSINIIITSFGVVQRALLLIRVDFKKQAKFSLYAVLISGLVGVVLAYYNFNVWALVVQSLLYSSINTLFYIINVRWYPREGFSFKSFKMMFGFGSKLLLSGLLNTIYLNLYSLVIGKYYSATNVGYYNRAYTLSQFPSTNIVQIVSRVIYPLQCQMQNENDRLKQSLLNYLRYTCFIIFPLMVGMAALSNPFIRFILTDSWEGAIIPMTILSISYMLYPIMHIDSQILTVKGRGDLFLKAEIVKKIVAVAILMCTVDLGVIILCVGIALYNVLDVIIIVFFVKKIIPVSFMDHVRNLGQIFVSAITMGIILYVFLAMFNNLSYCIQLFLGLFIGLFSYLLLCKVFHVREVSVIMSKVRLYIHQN